MRIKTVKYPKFSEVDFIRLYCAVNFKNGYSPIINHHELEKRLYKFYSLPEFKELFQNICPKKDSINPKNSYLDLGTALQTAQLFGLLTLIHDSGETRSIISCNEDIAQEIIANADAQMVDKMAKLFNEMFELNNSVYNQSNSHSNEAIVCEKTHVEKFTDNITNMRNPHIRDCVSLSEKYGAIEDYSGYQEQRDLENYKSFINSSAYDDVKEAESEIEKQLTLIKLRKISGMHDD